MTYRLLMLAALYIPLVGLAPLSKSWFFAQGIGQSTFENGASIAFLAYCLAFTCGLVVTEKMAFVRTLWSSPKRVIPDFGMTSALALSALVPMALFVLFAIGGIGTFINGVSAGDFRSSLGGGGAIGYLVLKYYSPVVVTILILVAKEHGRLFSWQVFVAVALHVTIAMSFGYKSAVVMAMLPPCILLFWHSHWSRIFGLGLIAFAILVAAYLVMKPADQASMSPVAAIFYRTFVLNAEEPWKIWDLHYRQGVELPPYIDTLPALLGDRAFSSITGITRGDPGAWAYTHFSVMMTHLSGYDVEYILERGHNNAANIFSEGVMAGGLAGALLFGLAAGAMGNTMCHVIENRLAARDYGAAAVGASYFIFAFIAWMLGGGVAEIAHAAVLFGALTAFIGARIMLGPLPSIMLLIYQRIQRANSV